MTNQPNEYRFNDDLADDQVVVVGVGQTGIDTLNYLCNIGTKDIQTFVCGHNPDALRASVVENKIWFPYDLDEDSLVGEQLARFQDTLSHVWTTFFVADLDESESRHLLLELIREWNRVPHRNKAPVVLLPSDYPTPLVSELIAALRLNSHGMIVLERPKSGTTALVTKNEGTLSASAYQLSSTVRILINLISGKRCADFFDAGTYLKTDDRVAIYEGSASGPNRADAALTDVLTQMQADGVTPIQAERLLVSVGGSLRHHVTMREGLTVSKMLLEQQKTTKLLCAMDNTLDDQLVVKILAWLPLW